MATERIDVALRWSSHLQNERHGTPLTEIKWFLTVAPAYITQHGLPSEPVELNDHACVYYRRDNSDDHHPELKSTSPKFFVAQFFTDAGPNRAKRAGIKKALQRTFTHEGWAE